MPKVVLENITKRYGKKVVVDNLSLEMKDRAFTCLLGPPGAGKTTILRIIAGLIGQDKGNIYFDHEKVNDLPPAKRDVAMVFQSFALYPHLSVYDNMASPLKKKKLSHSQIKRKIEEVSDILGISHLLEKPPALLSGGEKQRVAIGRAIAKEPKILLMDEPLSNLDAKLRLHMRVEMRKLQRNLNITTIFGTPDDIEALTMSDNIAVIKDGRLIQYDSAERVYDNPRNLFAAKFVGSPQMNIIKCVLEREEGTTKARFSAFMVDLSKYSDCLKDFSSGEELLFGVRPSDITILTNRTARNEIEAQVYTLEPWGADTVVNLRVGDDIIKVKAPSTLKLDADQKVHLEFSKEAIHLFNAKTEETIL